MGRACTVPLGALDRWRVGHILAFWFGSDPAAPLANQARWFKVHPAFDEEVRRRFAGLVAQAAAGAFVDWRRAPRPALAYVLLTDQFPRHLHRDDPRAFALDGLALAACLEGLEQGHDRALAPMERMFFYMPLQHAEEPALQERSVALCGRLAAEAPAPLREALGDGLRYARAHREVIARFGRFPHRNAVLGRPHTPEEQAFLREEGRGW